MDFLARAVSGAEARDAVWVGGDEWLPVRNRDPDRWLELSSVARNLPTYYPFRFQPLWIPPAAASGSCRS